MGIDFVPGPVNPTRRRGGLPRASLDSSSADVATRTSGLVPTIVDEPTCSQRQSLSEPTGDPVTTSSSPPDDEVRGQPSVSAPPTAKKRPIVWMVLTGIAILVAIGFGVWAVKVNSDLVARKTG